MVTLPSGPRARILLVEDEALIAEEIRERLARLNFETVAVCDTAACAISAATKHRPDLVLMDIRLKGNDDGVEAAHTIRTGLGLPVVFLTAHSDPATLMRAKAVDPLGYILKPVQERDLLVAIEFAIHRHALERRLRMSERRYTATLESVAGAVIATDPEGRVTFMNSVAEATTQWPFTEAVQLLVQQVAPLLADRSGPAFEHPTLTALSQRPPTQGADDVLMMCRDGSLIPVQYTARAIEDQGEVIGAVIAFRDLRASRLKAAALKRAEHALQQAQKMEALGRLAAGVAHDFNNVLTVISADVELALEQASLTDEVRRLLLGVADAGVRAAGLTRQLLAFSRQQDVTPVTIDVNQFLRNMSGMVQRLLGGRIRVHVKSGAGVALVNVDLSQFEMVILNLAANSRDAMPDGGQFSMSARVAEVEEEPERLPGLRAGRYVITTVSDTGVGMPPEVVAHAFEAFYTTKDVGRGTGLGLATVLGVVKRFGGNVYVDSAVNEGSTFRLYLPVADDTRGPATRDALRGPGRSDAARRGQP